MKTINWKAFTLKDYWHLVRRRKWILIIPLLVATLIAIVIAQITPLVYRTTTSLIAEESERGNVLKGLSSLPIPAQERLPLIQQRILSRKLLMQVAESLQLRNYLEQQKGIKIADTGVISTFRKGWIRLQELLHFRASQTNLTDEQMIQYMKDMISIKLHAIVIEISVTHSNPQLATNITNQLARNYVDDTRRRRSTEVNDIKEFILTQLQDFKEKLEQANKALNDAKESGILESLTNENITLINQRTKAEADLLGNELDTREKEQQISQLENQLQTDTKSGSSEVLQLRNEVASLEIQLNQLKTRYSDSWHAVRSLHTKLEEKKQQLAQVEQEADKALQARVSPKLQQLKEELKQLNLSKVEISRKRDQYDQALKMIPQDQSNASHLLREQQHYQELYSFLLQRLDESNLLDATERQKMGNVAEVLDEAVLPEHPIQPDKKMIVAAGMVVGCGLGLALLLVLEYFDHSIHTVEEVEQWFEGITVLGIIPKLKL
ncbi:hypothetical protein HYR99_19875 [Candidatus Poribacteria bacterium]|nr:hypothetical protein [Candidatus Poribacteria bacterium]